MDILQIETRDGVCPAYLYKPAGTGPWPAVLMFMDGQGIRPAMQEVAERLSGNGYVVLLPDLFYRSGPYAPVDPIALSRDPELRNAHRDKFMAPATPDKIMADTDAFLAVLADDADVAPGPVGAVGYCMGGRLALLAAGTYPDRIAVVASYHGGGLANDATSSPHLLAPWMKAKVYVAGATGDANFPDDMKARLEQALHDAGVAHVIETYPAKHGWVLRDTAVHDPAEAEHHWRTLVPHFDSVLKA